MLAGSHGFIRFAINNMFTNLSSKMQPLAVKKSLSWDSEQLIVFDVVRAVDSF